MSRTKGVVVGGELVWVWSDSHDIVLARMIEAAGADGVPVAWLDEWRVCACLPDLPFTTAEHPGNAERAVLLHVLRRTRELILSSGDVHTSDVRAWRLGEDLLVCDGSLLVDPVTPAQQSEVIDAYVGLLDAGILPRNCPVGAPAGR